MGRHDPFLREPTPGCQLELSNMQRTAAYALIDLAILRSPEFYNLSNVRKHSS